MPRFALLEHDWPENHGDFLLEVPGLKSRDGLGLCWTWRFPGDRKVWERLFLQGGSIEAERNTDHRAHYLDYQGAVTPAADGTPRGFVMIVFQGEFQWADPWELSPLEGPPVLPDFLQMVFQVHPGKQMMAGQMQLLESPEGWKFTILPETNSKALKTDKVHS
ncbi:hypothetical protein Spb1_18430 [Planctopirus ephydatiae]|uniref:Uncharacterized protein n=1 Tax=Planctopirus ephydatiae TaxID=2528019 RepID=A0A518GMQ3_9PLAN|nr:hypothetical protein [Planctopirus ephydatiae]QDV29923.1 hypothetical protein Spb1_18430 [Planctopirus ephydatiae]